MTCRIVHYKNVYECCSNSCYNGMFVCVCCLGKKVRCPIRQSGSRLSRREGNTVSCSIHTVSVLVLLLVFLSYTVCLCQFLLRSVCVGNEIRRK